MPKRHGGSPAGIEWWRGPLRFAAAISCMLCAIARPVAAQSVLLVRPSVDDPTLIDAFHRVEAELRIHHFDPQLREAAPDAALGPLAERAHALAAIALVLRSGQTTLDLWMRDRTTGKTSLRTLEAGQGPDAASLVAVRAVDLLRANIGEFDPDAPPAPAANPLEPPPSAAAGAPAPPPSAASTSRPRAAATAASIEVEACAIRPSGAFGVAVGTALGFYYRLVPPLALGVSVALPLTAADIATPSGEARVQQALAAAEARWLLLQTESFRLAPLIGLGAYGLRARGHPNAPLIARGGDIASFMAEVGVRAEYAFDPHFSIGAALRALALAPRSGVAVASHVATIDLPAFEATLGIAIGL
ncbi:MAG TPA: hypothetical protein VGI70_19060 [Polyangiales bacterium]